MELFEGKILDLPVADSHEVVLFSTVLKRLAVINAALSQGAQDGVCGVELLLLDVERAGHEKSTSSARQKSSPATQPTEKRFHHEYGCGTATK